MTNDYIKNNLYRYEQNHKNYSSLIDGFDRDCSVAFIGAGLPANMSHMLKWDELVVEVAKALGVTLRKAKKKIIEDEPEKIPEIFSYIYKKAKSKRDFYSSLFKLTSSNCNPPSIYTDIKKAFSCIVSTNYSDRIPIKEDMPEESKGRGMTRCYFNIPRDSDKQKSTITYLHGHEDIGFGIVRSEDYNYFYPSGNTKGDHASPVEETLRYIFKNRSIVFFGCGLETVLINYFSYLVSKDVQPKEHYWITSQSSMDLKENMDSQTENEMNKNFFNKYRNISIKPIVYKSDHIFLSTLCDQLSIKKKTVLEQPPDGAETRI